MRHIIHYDDDEAHSLTQIILQSGSVRERLHKFGTFGQYDMTLDDDDEANFIV